jgi:hypothetical protein
LRRPSAAKSGNRGPPNSALTVVTTGDGVATFGSRPDGSTMKVKSWNPTAHHFARARIRQISENLTKLVIECEDDSTVDLTLLDPGNSVSVRDKNN